MVLGTLSCQSQKQPAESPSCSRTGDGRPSRISVDGGPRWRRDGGGPCLDRPILPDGRIQGRPKRPGEIVDIGLAKDGFVGACQGDNRELPRDLVAPTQVRRMGMEERPDSGSEEDDPTRIAGVAMVPGAALDIRTVPARHPERGWRRRRAAARFELGVREGSAGTPKSLPRCFLQGCPAGRRAGPMKGNVSDPARQVPQEQPEGEDRAHGAGPLSVRPDVEEGQQLDMPPPCGQLPGHLIGQKPPEGITRQADRAIGLEGDQFVAVGLRPWPPASGPDPPSSADLHRRRHR